MTTARGLKSLVSKLVVLAVDLCVMRVAMIKWQGTVYRVWKKKRMMNALVFLLESCSHVLHLTLMSTQTKSVPCDKPMHVFCSVTELMDGEGDAVCKYCSIKQHQKPLEQPPTEKPLEQPPTEKPLEQPPTEKPLDQPPLDQGLFCFILFYCLISIYCIIVLL